MSRTWRPCGPHARQALAGAWDARAGALWLAQRSEVAESMAYEEAERVVQALVLRCQFDGMAHSCPWQLDPAFLHRTSSCITIL